MNIAKKVAAVAVGYRTVPVPGPDPGHVPSNDRANPVGLGRVIVVDLSGVNPIGTRRTVSIEARNHREAAVVVVIRSVIGTTGRTMAMKVDVEVVVVVVIPAVVVRVPVVAVPVA